jgi:hypothetical protein
MFVFALWLFMMMRFGILSGALGIFGAALSGEVPIHHRASSWLSVYDYLALAIFAVIVLYAFRTSLGGRPLIAASHLDD